MSGRNKLIAGAFLLAFLAGLYGLLHESGAMTTILDADALRAQVDQLDPWGPLVIVALMMLAVLISPIPSAPIALAAGAAFGHGWGTLYVLLGAGAGAMAAFGVARFVGYQTVQRWFGSRLSVGLAGSQNALMGIVFVSRLLPFLSFDIVSYAAGLTVLSFWRFTLATFAGIAPTSFLLAHFGSEMVTGESDRILWSVLALGGLTLIPLGFKLFRDWRSARQARGRDSE
ncbi:MAG: VTT domain-containing protein [Burkholderiaceae bacterium]|nr:VTT domain-containing protein [Burkholderiaceae bacterium]